MSESLHLLSLPGEIRSMIYDFALTAAEGIQYVEWFRNRPVLCATDSSSSLRIEFNHIKFANRQLYRETAALEGRFNVIYFLRDLLLPT
jgi:hypothetical protein